MSCALSVCHCPAEAKAWGATALRNGWPSRTGVCCYFTTQLPRAAQPCHHFNATCMGQRPMRFWMWTPCFEVAASLGRPAQKRSWIPHCSVMGMIRREIWAWDVPHRPKPPRGTRRPHLCTHGSSLNVHEDRQPLASRMKAGPNPHFDREMAPAGWRGHP